MSSDPRDTRYHGARRLERGLYGLFDGAPYPLRVHDGRWAFRSSRPAAGFTPDHGVFIRRIAADDHVECFGFQHSGVYRGLPVAVGPLRDGGLRLVSTDPAAAGLGFAAEELRRGGVDWRRIVREGDPELQVRSTRVPRPVPWADNPEEVLPPRASTEGRRAPAARGRDARGLRSTGLRTSGRYAVSDGAEYALVRLKGGWTLQSDHPEEGFTSRYGCFVRPVTPGEPLVCFTITQAGVYQDMVVEVDVTGDGHLRLVTRDKRAVERGFVPLGFERPEIQDYMLTVPLDEPALRLVTTREPTPAPWAQAPPVRTRGVLPPGWGELTAGLAATLRDVGDRSFLIVSTRSDPRRYVQLAGGPDLVDAEAPGTDVVADADEDALRTAGWLPPGTAQPSWTSSLDRSSGESERTALAQRCVAALRHAYGVRGPSDLVYAAWRHPGAGDPGATSLDLPDLGLPHR